MSVFPEKGEVGAKWSHPRGLAKFAGKECNNILHPVILSMVVKAYFMWNAWKLGCFYFCEISLETGRYFGVMFHIYEVLLHRSKAPLKFSNCSNLFQFLKFFWPHNTYYRSMTFSLKSLPQKSMANVCTVIKRASDSQYTKYTAPTGSWRCDIIVGSCA